MIKYINFKVLASVVVTLLCMSSANAIPIEELQELRLAKAELAYIDGNTAEALRIIHDNVSRKSFHLETYLFLAKIHFTRRDYPKGFRALYYVVKKLHTNKLINAQGKKFKARLKKTPAPSKKVLLIYEDIANKYYDLYARRAYPQATDAVLLGLSYKYFSILEHYDYYPANTKYMLARISQKLRKFNLAIEKFLEAKELFIEMNEAEGIDDANTTDLDFDIGDILIQQGLMDAGSIYLQTLYQNPQTSPSLREYASVYLQSLSRKFTSTSLILGFSAIGNVNQLTDTVIDDFANLGGSTNRVSGTSRNVGVSFFQSSNRMDNWQFFGSLSYNQSNFLQDDIKYADSRVFGFSIDTKYDNLSKSLVRAGYSGSLIYNRPTVDSDFAKYLMIHSFFIQYSHILKAGMLSYKIPLTLNNYQSLNDTYDYGIEVSLTPYQVATLWSPSYNLSYTSVGEDIGNERSTQITAALSNHLKLSDSSSIFFDPGFTMYSNQNTSFNFKQYSLSATWSLYLAKFFGLSQTLNQTFSRRDYQNGTRVREATTTISWSYNF